METDGMRFDDFMTNPNGKHGTGGMQLRSVVNDFTSRYSKYKLKDKECIVSIGNIASNGKNLYIHFLVKSESDRENTYDVVIAFKNAMTSVSTNIKGAEIRIFSNSPSFTYTYAYAYNKKQLLLTPLKEKYKPIVLSQAPKKTNPYKLSLYDKSVYYCLIYMKENPIYFNKIRLATMKMITFKELVTKIRHMDTIEVEYYKADNKMKEEKKDSVEALAKKIKTTTKANMKSNVSKSLKVTNTTSRTKVAKPSSSVKVVKKLAKLKPKKR